MSESHGDVIEVPAELRAVAEVPAARRPVGAVASAPPEPRARGDASPRPSGAPALTPSSAPVDARPDPGADAIRAALAKHEGRVAEAARTLGLSSRYALYRLMKKYGIDAETPSS
jgi:two-component system nitrogen regulation response regulator GlnG/two-component system response regulator HydG